MGNDRPASAAINALRALTHEPEPKVIQAPAPPLRTDGVVGRGVFVG